LQTELSSENARHANCEYAWKKRQLD